MARPTGAFEAHDAGPGRGRIGLRRPVRRGLRRPALADLLPAAFVARRRRHAGRRPGRRCARGRIGAASARAEGSRLPGRQRRRRDAQHPRAGGVVSATRALSPPLPELRAKRRQAVGDRARRRCRGVVRSRPARACVDRGRRPQPRQRHRRPGRERPAGGAARPRHAVRQRAGDRRVALSLSFRSDGCCSTATSRRGTRPR